MTAAISVEELLTWNQQSAAFWKAHFDANPALLELPCGIDGAPNVQELVRHIWMAELRWAQRVASLPILARENLPKGPLEALYGLHLQATQIIRSLLSSPSHDWEKIFTLEYDWLAPELQSASRRKLVAHALFHSQRHWAQLTTLVREAGFPSAFQGDLIFSPALA